MDSCLRAIISCSYGVIDFITLRSAGQCSAQAEARANACMALMVALGELQKQMGPDQRISANVAILSETETDIRHPHWTRVWDSWIAGPLASDPIPSTTPLIVEG